MSWFLVTTSVLVLGLVVYALIDEWGGVSRQDSYEIPKDWKSPIYRDKTAEHSAGRQTSKPEATTDDDTNAHAPREMTSTLWYTIFFVFFITCLIFLSSNWEWLDEWWTKNVKRAQVNAHPAAKSSEE